MIGQLDKAINRLLYPIRPYWTASIYGYSKWIRRYGYYPPFLPLCIYTDHGPGDSSRSPYKHELESDAPVQFYHSRGAIERWVTVSAKPCYQLFSPFVFARRSLRIERSPTACGSVFFPSHNTESITDLNDSHLYADEISRLPERFHPVTICLHITDMRLGIDKVYKAHGYRVVTAGDSLHQDFTERFYNIIKNFRYSLSNEFGAYGLYATELGIPFGLFGTKPQYFNAGDENFKIGKYECYKEKDYYINALHLFDRLPGDNISEGQKKFAEEFLGMNGGVSRPRMAAILYKSLAFWLLERLHIIKIKYHAKVD